MGMGGYLRDNRKDHNRLPLASRVLSLVSSKSCFYCVRMFLLEVEHLGQTAVDAFCLPLHTPDVEEVLLNEADLRPYSSFRDLQGFVHLLQYAMLLLKNGG